MTLTEDINIPIRFPSMNSGARCVRRTQGEGETLLRGLCSQTYRYSTKQIQYYRLSLICVPPAAFHFYFLLRSARQIAIQNAR